MPFLTRKTALVLFTVLVVPVVFIVGFVWTGLYNIGADDPHWRPTQALLETVRHRSIDTRASELQVPTDLSDPARIRQGAGNYDAMCTGCHLTPGMSETELSKGLYPAPPNLTKANVDAAHAFWVIKHGIKASGMPAWGKSMEDAYIWNVAAFLQQLPKLDEAQYKSLVASSGGHSHGGGESGEDHHDKAGANDDHHDEGEAGHHHEEGEGADHDMAGMDMKTGESEGHPHGQPAAAQGETHVHADDNKHVHAPKAGPSPTAPKSDAAVAQKADTKTSKDTTVEPEQHEHQH